MFKIYKVKILKNIGREHYLIFNCGIEEVLYRLKILQQKYND